MIKLNAFVIAGQSRLTRDYLRSIKQEDLGLPEGPMLLNPTSLLNAFHTLVFLLVLFSKCSYKSSLYVATRQNILLKFT